MTTSILNILNFLNLGREKPYPDSAVVLFVKRSSRANNSWPFKSKQNYCKTNDELNRQNTILATRKAWHDNNAPIEIMKQ